MKNKKRMNIKLKIGMLLLIAALVALPGASATPGFAAATGASCGTCHVNPAGGGTLTAVGQIYKQTGSISTATLPTIEVSPSTASLAVNDTQTFTVLDKLGNIISTIFSWVSSNPAVGTIDTTGKFTALSAGTTTITATNDTTSGSAIVSVGTVPAGTHEQEEQEVNEQLDEQEHNSTHEHVNTQEDSNRQVHTSSHGHTNTQVRKGATDKNEKD
ncbi:MAG: Ig-like domain-containing protein [Candidatus Methanoperedens sp.]|nr:Ig-like domain-containing protein [Candidatus Methanoperedens sp.]MCZ7405108.1 Ig-like domain-containing protein [Candidatus Methanoperedens sp.]